MVRLAETEVTCFPRVLARLLAALLRLLVAPLPLPLQVYGRGASPSRFRQQGACLCPDRKRNFCWVVDFETGGVDRTRGRSRPL